jgi:hypothetical protein
MVASRAAVMASMMLIGPSPARADGVFSEGCARGFACAGFWRSGIANPHVIFVPPPRSKEEADEADERDRRWEARCHPVVRQDMHGVRRYHYAVPGCEYGKYE